MTPVEVTFSSLAVVGILSFLAGTAFALLLLAGYMRDIANVQRELLDRVKLRRGE